jgi:hypothetical protein
MKARDARRTRRAATAARGTAARLLPEPAERAVAHVMLSARSEVERNAATRLQQLLVQASSTSAYESLSYVDSNCKRAKADRHRCADLPPHARLLRLTGWPRCRPTRSKRSWSRPSRPPASPWSTRRAGARQRGSSAARHACEPARAPSSARHAARPRLPRHAARAPCGGSDSWLCPAPCAAVALCGPTLPAVLASSAHTPPTWFPHSLMVAPVARPQLRRGLRGRRRVAAVPREDAARAPQNGARPRASDALPRGGVGRRGASRPPSVPRFPPKQRRRSATSWHPISPPSLPTPAKTPAPQVHEAIKEEMASIHALSIKAAWTPEQQEQQQKQAPQAAAPAAAAAGGTA